MDKREMFVVLIVCIVVGGVYTNDDLIVNTAVGTIRGVRSEDGEYNMYMGIPYATINASNPFGANLPPPYFDEIFEANDHSSQCPQIEEFNNTVVGDLECLRLNIYTPLNNTPESNLPVYVWIYGGRFNVGFYGRYLYGPKYLVRDDIIVVTMNYRLGPYGFMCLDIPEVPGNQGFKDQITALRWINSHIRQFGGNPDKVTIGGNSAGGMSADYHLHRDDSDETLFHQVIIQSGTALVPEYDYPVKDTPQVIARYLGFDTDNIYDALEFLAAAPPRDIILGEEAVGISSTWICVEQTFEGVDNYMTTNWVTREIPAINKMPVIVGVTSDEVGIWRMNTPSETDTFLYNLEPMFYTEHEDFRGITDLVHQFYNGDETVPDSFDTFIDFQCDTSFVYSTYQTVYKYIENNAGNIYMYNFSYVGERNFVRRRRNVTQNVGGAYHADEISYIFEAEFIPEEPTPDDQIVIDKMSRMWTNFVKYGNPTPEVNELIDVKWEPIRRDSPLYVMEISKNLSLKGSPIAERSTFWDLIYENIGHLQRIATINSTVF